MPCKDRRQSASIQKDVMHAFRLDLFVALGTVDFFERRMTNFNIAAS
jgi:hypothetical protein